MSEEYGGPQWVGIDLHRRRSVIVRMTDEGETLESIRIVNDPERLRNVLARAGEAPEVVMEAPTAGTGLRTPSPTPARSCTWHTRWA